MIINGLDGEIYYLNNPIYFHASQLDNTKYLELTVTVNNTSTRYKYYASPSGEVLVDIRTIIRSLFSQAEANNIYDTVSYESTLIDASLTFTKTMNDNTTSTQTLNKKFLRGGKVGNYNNLLASTHTALVTVEKIPVWSSYPSAIYHIDNSKQVRKTPLNTSSSYTEETLKLSIQHQEKRSAEGVYLKFLNSLGGYSYYLFETSETSLNAKHIGSFVTPYLSGEKLRDMGHEVSEEMTVESVVKAEYINLIKDLIVSSEVYAYQKDNTWLRVTADGNSVTENKHKKTYEVSIKLNKYNNFKPTTLI